MSRVLVLFVHVVLVATVTVWAHVSADPIPLQDSSVKEIAPLEQHDPSPNALTNGAHVREDGSAS